MGRTAGLNKFREKIPDVAIRTTILTGFPGETEEAFTELLDFIGSFRFERMGVFPYSHEEGTPAYRNLEDQVPDRVKAKRAGILMDLQQSISLQLNEQKVGMILKVLIDRREGEYFVGRSQYDSPEVDNEVLVKYNPALHPGRFYQVRITGAGEFDLYGETETV